MSNFSFFPTMFSIPCEKLSAIFIKFEIVVFNLEESNIWERVKCGEVPSLLYGKDLLVFVYIFSKS